MNEDEIKSLISRRRRQILVHSCIYYRFNDNIISDSTYDTWSKELADLQKQHPDIAKQAVWADAFKDFDGSTGFDLPIYHPEVVDMAIRLLSYHKSKK